MAEIKQPKGKKKQRQPIKGRKKSSKNPEDSGSSDCDDWSYARFKEQQDKLKKEKPHTLDDKMVQYNLFILKFPTDIFF